MLFLHSYEMLDLVNSCLHGRDAELDTLFQRAFTLTALDRRPYATPLESPRDRLVNVAECCRKFGLDSPTVNRIVSGLGFASVTLLSLMSEKHIRIVSAILRLTSEEQRKLRECVIELNRTPLEPLYSVKRYLHIQRRRKPQKLEDILHLDKPAIVRIQALRSSPTPPSILGGGGSLTSSSEEEEEEDKLRSGFCPFFFCEGHGRKWDRKRLDLHMTIHHNLLEEADLFHWSKSDDYGSVQLQFSLREVSRVRSESVVWFGPTRFRFDGLSFYEVVYRIPGKTSEVNYIFRLFAETDSVHVQQYSFVISLFKEKNSRTIKKRPIASLEEDPSSSSKMAYFVFDENQLKRVAFPDGTLKYFVKIFKTNKMLLQKRGLR